MGGRASVAGTVPNAPSEVFTFLTDLDRLPEWNAIMTRLVDRPEALALPASIDSLARVLQEASA